MEREMTFGELMKNNGKEEKLLEIKIPGSETIDDNSKEELQSENAKKIAEQARLTYQTILNELIEKEKAGKTGFDAIISGDRMMQLQQEAARKANGTGIGMSISNNDIIKFEEGRNRDEKLLDEDRKYTIFLLVKDLQKDYTNESILAFSEAWEAYNEDRVNNPKKYGPDNKIVDDEYIAELKSKYLVLKSEAEKEIKDIKLKENEIIKINENIEEDENDFEDEFDINPKEKEDIIKINTGSDETNTLSNVLKKEISYEEVNFNNSIIEQNIEKEDYKNKSNEITNSFMEEEVFEEPDKEIVEILDREVEKEKDLLDEESFTSDSEEVATSKINPIMEIDKNKMDNYIESDYFKITRDNTIDIPPESLRNLKPSQRFELLNNNLGRRFTQYMPNSNYVASFNETSDNSHVDTMFMGFQNSGEIGDINVFKAIYDTMSFKVEGEVSFHDFLRYTSIKDVPFLYMAYAKVNAPTKPKTDIIEIPILNVICDHCGSQTALNRNKPLMVDLDLLYRKSYPLEKLKEKEINGEIIINKTIKELSSSANFKDNIKFESNNKKYMIALKDPSIYDFITGFNKYTTFLFDKTIEFAEKEFINEDEPNITLETFRKLNNERKTDYINSFNPKRDIATDKAFIWDAYTRVNSMYGEIIAFIPFIKGIITCPSDELMFKYANQYKLTEKEAYNLLKSKLDFTKDIDIHEAIEVLSKLESSVFDKIKDQIDQISESGDLLDSIKIEYSKIKPFISKTGFDRLNAALEKKLNDLPENTTEEERASIREEYEIQLTNIKSLKCACGSTDFHISPSMILFFSIYMKQGVVTGRLKNWLDS